MNAYGYPTTWHIQACASRILCNHTELDTCVKYKMAQMAYSSIFCEMARIGDV